MGVRGLDISSLSSHFREPFVYIEHMSPQGNSTDGASPKSHINRAKEHLLHVNELHSQAADTLT